MQDCAYMQELISRMIDGELDADEQAVLAKHLEDCPACRTMYDAFNAVSPPRWARILKSRPKACGRT